MEHSRKLVIIGSVLLIIFIVLLFIFNPKRNTSSPDYWIGLVIGGVLGTLSCIYIAKAWEPIGIRSQNDPHNNDSSRWMPISVGAGIIVMRIISWILPEYTTVLGNCLVSWVFIVLSYFVYQIWVRHPKN